MKKTVKNFISILLVVAMLVTLFPGDFSVLAEGPAEPAAEGTPAGEAETGPGETDTPAGEPDDETDGAETPASDPDGPAADPEEPATDPDAPAADPDAPATDPDEPSGEPNEPGDDPDAPSTDPDEPGDDPDEPGDDPDAPAADPDAPATDPVEPSGEPDAPSTDPEEPGDDPDEPAADSDEPGEAPDDTDAPAEEPDAPAAEPDTPAEESEAEPIAFVKSTALDGVRITVSADPGVFPADAVLSVQSVPVDAQQRVDAAVDAKRDENTTLVVSYTFDIKVLDADGNELQPAPGQRVSVSFAQTRVADPNLDTQVYHITETDGALSAQELAVSESGYIATAQTEGFSYYTVEFTYDAMTYVLPGGSTVPLADILTAVGLSGDVSAVTCSDESLFSAAQADGVWTVTLHRSFTSTEWMDVTIGGVSYRITVTDDIASGTYDGVDWLITDEGQLQIGNTGTVQTFATTADWRNAVDYPWYAYRDQVTSVTFVNTVNGNGAHNYMFSNFSVLTSADLTNFNTAGVTTFYGLFNFCKQLTSLTGLTCSANTKSLYSMLEHCESLTTFDGRGLDTSGVTSMGLMLYYCPSLTTVLQPAGGWNMGSVKDTDAMFQNCSALTTLDTSGWTMTEVTDMSYMFWGCTELTTLDVSGWKTDNVTNMYGTFCGCSKVTVLDVSDWKTANVTDMTELFSMCNSVKSLDLSGWTMTGATRTSMLDSMPELIEISLGANCRLGDTNFSNNYNTRTWSSDMSVVYSAANLITAFDGSPGTLQGVYKAVYTITLTPGSGSGSNVTAYAPIIDGSYTLPDAPAGFSPPVTGQSLWHWDLSGTPYAPGAAAAVNGNVSFKAVWAFFGTYDGVDWLITPADATPANQLQIGSRAGLTQDYNNVEPHGAAYWPWLNYKANITSVNFISPVSGNGSHAEMFLNCYNLTVADLTAFDTADVTSLNSLFEDDSVLESVTGLTCSASTTDLADLFRGCRSLTAFDGGGLVTDNVTSMAYMFTSCNALASLTNYEGWETGNVADMSYLFYGCNSLTTLDVSAWDTGNVTNMAKMFDGSGFETLDLSSWDTSSVTDMSYMFEGCAVSDLNMTGWDTSHVTTMWSMFSACSNLQKLDISGFDMSNVTSYGWMISGNALEELVLGTQNKFGTRMFFSDYNWCLDSDLTVVYTASDFNSGYDGATMAGTYVRVYTISFDANGGTGTMADRYVAYNAPTLTLPACGFTAPTGFLFESWNRGDPGEGVVFTGDTTVSAQWYQVWNAPMWTWAEDASAATVVFTCLNDPDGLYTETLNANVTVVTVTEPTCEETGSTAGTGSVMFLDTEYTDAHDGILQPLGHDWGDVTYVWAENHMAATASHTCSRCGEESETVDATAVVTREATCIRLGETTYTASFTNAAFTAQTVAVEDRPLAEHKYDAIWHTSPEGHWHICTVCAKVDEVRPHGSFGANSVEHSEICDVCGVEINPPLIIRSLVGFDETGSLALSTLTFTKTQDAVDNWNMRLPETEPDEEHYYFEGWSLSSDGELHEPGESFVFSYSGEPNLSVTGVWTLILETGENYDLDGGMRYRLGSGRFRITGDDTIYPGDQPVYPVSGGNFTISSAG